MADQLDREAVLAEMTQKAKDFEALLALLSQKGYIPKKQRVKRQVIYKTKFVTRKPRTKKEKASEAEGAGEEAGPTTS